MGKDVGYSSRVGTDVQCTETGRVTNGSAVDMFSP